MYHSAWYHSWLLWLLAGVAVCLMAALVGFFVWRRMTAARRQTLATLRNIADRLLRNVVLPDGVGGHVAADAIMLRDSRLYVLAIHDVEGAIFGSEKMDQWTTMGRHQRFTFRNPLRLMHDRVLALHTLVPELTIVPRILFTARGHFPKGRPGGVELLEEFAAPLRRPKKTAPPLLDARLEAVWTRLRDMAGVPPGKEVPEFGAKLSDAAGT